MNKLLTCLVILSLSTLFAATVLADDFFPPDWRGDILTVLAGWEFDADFTADPDNVLPDVFNTIGNGQFEFGDCVTHAHLDSLAWQVDPDDPLNGWVINLDDMPHIADFVVANWVDDYEFKHIWIQITWGGQAPPIVTQVIAPDPGTGSWTNPAQATFMTGFDPDPNHHVEYWVLVPNPDCEAIDILLPPGTWLDEVVIDTICSQDEVDNESSSWGQVKALFR